ncbi:DUF2155 domain-containing protein [Aliiroseovarius sp. S1123]|uniref:DUF2155 domain-containing protein n=1 Tax=unclassified Aliiroseovarius TaxID=2623558 RepID=UPI001FF35C07|nr:DUF2155 domain-containing protein [uncultured Aliiroseovarius sp.]MCK0172203.1 DUF2155 domain-containing protein [Aliiroseovarius sp. S1123]
MIRAAVTLSAALFAASTAWAETAKASGAFLRGLDKVSGTPVDFKMNVGDTVELGRLRVTLGECRYPTDNPSGDAFAWLVVRDGNAEETTFEGWMIASSPALNALDHPRYDVWVLRCVTE